MCEWPMAMDNGVGMDCGSGEGVGEGEAGESNGEKCKTTVIEQQI